MLNKWYCLCLCICFLAEIPFTQAGKLPADALTQNPSSPTRENNVTDSQQRWTWNQKKTLEFNKWLVSEEDRLKNAKTYGIIEDLIANPGCDIEPLNTSEKPGSLILTALGTSTLLVSKGCPDRALEAVRVMTEILSGELVNPIDVKNKEACSTEAEKAMRILLSDYPKLKHVYFMMATGVYSASGCKHLVASVVPALVRYITQFSGSHTSMQLYPESCSDDIVIFNSTQKMEEAYKDLQNNGMLPQDNDEHDRVKRQSASECPSMAREAVGSLIDFIPVVGPIYSGISIARNIYKGCTSNLMFQVGTLAVKMWLG